MKTPKDKTSSRTVRDAVVILCFRNQKPARVSLRMHTRTAEAYAAHPALLIVAGNTISPSTAVRTGMHSVRIPECLCCTAKAVAVAAVMDMKPP